jgi:hypothetical protein
MNEAHPAIGDMLDKWDIKRPTEAAGRFNSVKSAG